MTQPLHERIADYIRGLDPYRPGKPVEEVERELKIHAVKLASNENPLGPSPMAVDAARQAVAEANRYPDGGGHYLREKLAKRFGLAMENVMLGLGSGELIDLAARVLLHPSTEGLTSEGTFPLYWLSIRAAGAKLVQVPLRDYTFDLDRIAAAITPQTRVIYIANPNNPTGTLVSQEAADAFLGRVPEDVLVVMDEAYCDYAGTTDSSHAMEWVRRGRNVLVLRTFSKVYGLAGMRVGYGFGPAGLLEEMNKVRTPFNTSSVAQMAALAAMDDHDHVRRSVEANRAGLRQLTAGLAEMGARFVPSVANFQFIEAPEGGQKLYEELLRRGVIVRPMAWMGFPNAIRVSVGRAEENELFLNALGEIRGVKAPARPSGAGVNP